MGMTHVRMGGVPIWGGKKNNYPVEKKEKGGGGNKPPDHKKMRKEISPKVERRKQL